MASRNSRKNVDKENQQKGSAIFPKGLEPTENMLSQGNAIGNRPKLATINVNRDNEDKAAATHRSQAAPIHEHNVRKFKNVLCSKAENHQKSTNPSKPFVVFDDQQQFAGKHSTTQPAVAAHNKELLLNEKARKVYSCTELEATERPHIATADQRVESAKETAHNVTPISLSDLFSPMSVECHSPVAGATHGSNLPRHERHRLLEELEYFDDILAHCFESEKKHRPHADYMRRQQDINCTMRKILVDWLAEIVEYFRLHTETLYLTVWYIDCFLSRMTVLRKRLQLVGATALFIAAKYEEIFTPTARDLVYLSGEAFSKDQLLFTEKKMLKALCFNLSTPTPLNFINMYALKTGMPADLKHLTMYICELSLLKASPSLHFLASCLAAAAHALARYIQGDCIWSSQLQEVTKYKLENLKEACLALSKLHKAAPNYPQQAIQSKYKSKKYSEVATIRGVNLTAELFDDITMKYNELVRRERKESPWD